MVGSAFSGRAEVKFHSSSVATPFRDAIPACVADSVRSNRAEEVWPGLLLGGLLKGDEDLELDATSAANGSGGTCREGAALCCCGGGCCCCCIGEGEAAFEEGWKLVRDGSTL